ncbi:Os02g0297666 [Oryza sativa Japonica Group]|uniref:Os02g0297666 protein n=1 Tax=Oryza sativa subsp. japonica TaxID=39947 RepID=A0A0P0VHV9_ORYSJ|nr:hypothetical protein EE612_010595 [Oryza sativa]BAS78229.1 Os02g0297666 [Oryza sativa Japonica Group]
MAQLDEQSIEHRRLQSSHEQAPHISLERNQDPIHGPSHSAEDSTQRHASLENTVAMISTNLHIKLNMGISAPAWPLLTAHL